MRKAQYGLGKQLLYRDAVFGFGSDSRKSKSFVMATLAGRDAIWNLNSDVWQFFNRYENCTIALIERGLKEANVLVKDLQKRGFKLVYTQLLDKHAHGQNFLKSFEHSRMPGKTFEVYYDTMKGYLNRCVKTNRRHDVINCDYYRAFMQYYREDIKIIRDNDLLKRGGDLFVTAPDPRREITQPAVQFVIRQDPAKKSFETGMRNLLKNLFKGRNKIEKCHSWQYCAEQDNPAALLMNVVRLRVA